MRFVCLALVIIITGCNTVPRQGINTGDVRQIESWEIKGRLGARIDQQGGSASFIWQRQRDNHSIELYGPLGSGRIFLNQTAGKASLIDNSAEFFGDNLQDVLFVRTGWLIPFDRMQQWIVGQPEHDAISDLQFEHNRLINFSQSGWQVSYDKFEEFSGAIIPTKITLTAINTYLDELSVNSGRQFKNARVKIIIKAFTHGLL